ISFMSSSWLVPTGAAVASATSSVGSAGRVLAQGSYVELLLAPALLAAGFDRSDAVCAPAASADAKYKPAARTGSLTQPYRDIEVIPEPKRACPRKRARSAPTLAQNCGGKCRLWLTSPRSAQLFVKIDLKSIDIKRVLDCFDEPCHCAFARPVGSQ